MKDRSKVSIGKPCNTCICTLTAYAKRVHEQCIMLDQLSDSARNHDEKAKLKQTHNDKVGYKVKLTCTWTHPTSTKCNVQLNVKICPKLTATPSKYAVRRYQNIAP